MIRVQAEDFDAGAEAARMTAGRSDIGAVVTFTGLVRGESAGRTLRFLTLEHYPDMTEKELRRIAAEALDRWPLQDVLIVHRYGRLAPGDNIVLAAAASAHREAAFEAASFLMDYLKTSAPFWKKETFADGGERWIETCENDEQRVRAWQGVKPGRV